MRLHVERASVHRLLLPPGPLVPQSCWPGVGVGVLCAFVLALSQSQAHPLPLCLRVGVSLVFFPPLQPEEMAEQSGFLSQGPSRKSVLFCFLFSSLGNESPPVSEGSSLLPFPQWLRLLFQDTGRACAQSMPSPAAQLWCLHQTCTMKEPFSALHFSLNILAALSQVCGENLEDWWALLFLLWLSAILCS